MIGEIKLVCFYGPESVGKSTLARTMAEQYETIFVPEVAREMITSNDFTADDIVRIGREQYRRMMSAIPNANRVVFCDTDAITTQIYSQHYLGIIPDELFELEKAIRYDHYFLFDIDVPWIPDGLRDLPHMRAEMFRRFKQALDERSLEYTLVQGDWTQREETVTRKIDSLLETV